MSTADRDPFAHELGTLIGAPLGAVLRVLDRFGYVASQSGEAGTYARFYDGDVDPRTGASSAAIVVYEDRARPVMSAIHVALGE